MIDAVESESLRLTLLTAIPLMSLNMFLPSLGVMAREFEVGYDTMAFAVSGYLAFAAILQILSGPVADRYGRRPVLLASLSLFAAASIGCAMALTLLHPYDVQLSEAIE